MSKKVKMIKKGGKLKLLALVSVIYMTIYLIWRAVFTLPMPKEYGWIAFFLGIALLVAEFTSAVEAFEHYTSLTNKIVPEMPDIPIEWYPDVDILIATHNEDEEILYKTANACTYIKYPFPEKVHVYFCDDGNRPSVKELADRLGVGYFGLADNKEAKAGNLNNALAQTSSPLVVTFDADMIPTSNFLMETVPYFFLPKMKKDDEGRWVPKEEDEIDEDDKIGFIQSPQSFYNPDLFQYNLFSEGKVPNEQDYFFRQVNIGRNASNSPIYAGSNTVISRDALEEVGGICTNTITEDFETGLLIQSKGYKCYAIDKQLAKGLAPTTVASLIKQRERWARGCIHSLRKNHIILNRKIPFKTKLSYMACRSYWDSFLRRFVYIISPLIFVLLGIPAVICGLKELILIWAPTYFLYSLTLRVTSGNIRSSRLSNAIDTIMFPYLMVPILAEVLHIHKSEFVVTNKSRQNKEESNVLYALPHIVLLSLSLVALFYSLKDLLLYQAFGGIVIIFWLIVNSSSLLMAIFFMIGRENVRNSERFNGEVPVTLYIDNQKIKAVTDDLSEGGLSVIIREPIYIPKDEIVVVKITDKDYKASMKMKLVQIMDTKDNNYKYCFVVDSIEEKDKREYFQIIYDREHSLPKTISAKSSLYGDIAVNIKRRMDSQTNYSRKLPRIAVNKRLPLVGGGVVLVKVFNYEYVQIDNNGILLNNARIDIGNNLILECVKERNDLYRITNLDELQNNELFCNIVSQWSLNEE